jgi:hypothetical protein
LEISPDARRGIGYCGPGIHQGKHRAAIDGDGGLVLVEAVTRQCHRLFLHLGVGRTDVPRQTQCVAFARDLDYGAVGLRRDQGYAAVSLPLFQHLALTVDLEDGGAREQRLDLYVGRRQRSSTDQQAEEQCRYYAREPVQDRLLVTPSR